MSTETTNTGGESTVEKVEGALETAGKDVANESESLLEKVEELGEKFVHGIESIFHHKSAETPTVAETTTEAAPETPAAPTV